MAGDAPVQSVQCFGKKKTGMSLLQEDAGKRWGAARAGGGGIAKMEGFKSKEFGAEWERLFWRT
jgi:hypothetical protein